MAGAIRTGVADGTMRQRGATLGEKIRHEDGIGKAIEVIEALGRGR